MFNQVFMCSQCGKAVDVNDIKYHTADKMKIFCGAECSVNWHHANREQVEQRGK